MSLFFLFGWGINLEGFKYCIDVFFLEERSL